MISQHFFSVIDPSVPNDAFVKIYISGVQKTLQCRQNTSMAYVLNLLMAHLTGHTLMRQRLWMATSKHFLQTSKWYYRSWRLKDEWSPFFQKGFFKTCLLFIFCVFPCHKLSVKPTLSLLLSLSLISDFWCYCQVQGWINEVNEAIFSRAAILSCETWN